MLKYLYNRFFPRFITEPTAFIWDEECEEYIPICSVYDVREGEQFDAVGIVRGFNLFGIMISGKQIGEMISWDEFMRAVERGKNNGES